MLVLLRIFLVFQWCEYMPKVKKCRSSVLACFPFSQRHACGHSVPVVIWWVLEAFFIQTPAVKGGFWPFASMPFFQIGQVVSFFYLWNGAALWGSWSSSRSCWQHTVEGGWTKRESYSCLKERRLMPPVPLEMGLFCHKRGDCNAASEFFTMQTPKNDLTW